ncbi:BQ2448_5661 [Microbotryum intermedium]|uniref:mRNA cap guanine-N(7) methyltransferase n=1 Tax=Microbotryum intermedium TaxID=269621 RepID=A0A238F1X4_9BASI|nr:BQ2448_5661 [Microbotryum intermedium]
MRSLHDLLGSPHEPTTTTATTTPLPRPYAPTKRVSEPYSVLIPITRLELVQSHTSANPLRVQATTNLVASTTMATPALTNVVPANGLPKRPRSTTTTEEDEQANKRGRIQHDVTLVTNHYNARPNFGRQVRTASPIIGLKNFNNWIKSVLINRYGRPQPNPSNSHLFDRGVWRGDWKVMDMCCGKGGDLMKWSKAGVKDYYGLDVAGVSTDIFQILEPAQLDPLFDVVSMQFCMHYAFESSDKARQMLKNVADSLRVGGTFLGTIPDSDKLMDKLNAIPADEDNLAFGNEVYGIKFDERDWVEQFGHRYTFFLQDAVEEVPEYVVHWEALAREFDLHLEYKSDFQDIFLNHKDEPDFAQLLKRMRVIDDQGDTEMTPEQWEAATIYLGFVMTKVGPKDGREDLR